MLVQIPREEYDALDALNWSKLKLLERSPAHYVQGYGDDSSGFNLGTGTHAAILEPEKFERDFVTFKGRRYGKAWDEFETAAVRSGKTVLSEKEHAQALAMRKAVLKHKRAAALLTGGQAEFSMVWNLGAFKCKGRGDYLSSALVDLKTTKDASPQGFGRACKQYGYLGQAAWYSDGYTQITGERLPFVIVAVESSAPYIVQPYRVTPDQLERGREQYLTLLGKLDYCQKTGFWGGYSEAEELDLTVEAA